jgi:hypothetical protein
MSTLREALKSAIAGTALESRVLEEHALDVATAQRRRRRTRYLATRAETRRGVSGGPLDNNIKIILTDTAYNSIVRP